MTTLAERYGSARTRRPVAYAAGGLLAAVGLGWVVWAGVHHASPEVDGGLVSWRVRSDRAVDLVVEVRKAPGSRVTCDLMARDIDHVAVGQTSLHVTDPRRHLYVPARLATSRRAVTADVTGCRPTGAR